MNTDRVLSILSIVIGLPAFLALFFSSQYRTEGALTSIIILLVLGAWWWYRRDQEQPQFKSLELRKTYKLLTLDGSEATVQRFERLRANFHGITEWWNRSLVSDGTISNLLIDACPPSLIEDRIGATDVCKRFGRPLEKGEEVAITMTFDLKNAFLKSHESIVHSNSSNVKEITITIELPKPCTRAELRQTYSGDHGKLLAPPKLNANNHIIEVKIKKPRMGASYHVDWNW